MESTRGIKLEGYTANEILSMADEELNNFVFIGEPLVFLIGSAQILGEFRVKRESLIIELAQIEGGGEGVLQSLWLITEQYARKKNLQSVEWIVHAINCAKPNLKLRRVLIKKGFEIKDIEGIGEAYYYNEMIHAPIK